MALSAKKKDINTHEHWRSQKFW